MMYKQEEKESFKPRKYGIRQIKLGVSCLKTPVFKKHLSVWMILLLSITSCNYVKNIRLLTGGSLERTHFVDTLPFRYEKKIIVVEAHVNGLDETSEFIFDTGAFESKIEHSLATRLTLPTAAEKTNSTAQGISRTIEVTRLDSIQIGSTPFYSISAGKVKYDKTSASPCLAKDGIIGANLIKLAYWKIDYEQRELSFSDHSFPITASGELPSISFKHPLLSGTPEIEIQLEGRIISGVLFDVGYNGGLVLPRSFANEFTSKREKVIVDQSTSGIYGTNRDTLLTKELTLQLGGVSKTIEVEFSSLDKALLGNDILEHFDIYLDFNKKRIALNPVSDIHVASSSLFIPSAINDSLWAVSRIGAGNATQGGDTLRTINGAKPMDVFDSYCDYFLKIREFLGEDSVQVETYSGLKRWISL